MKLHIKKATIKDIKSIHSLINKHAKRDQMLARSLSELYEHMRDYFICTDNGKTIATSALHVMWEDIAELRSIAVSRAYQSKGVGKKLVEYCLNEAKTLGIKKVFALTYSPDFLIESGFKVIDKNDLPQKIWGDCLKCHKFPDCDEVAVIRKIKA